MIFDIMRAGLTQRFHATPGLPAQSVAEHSWGVAMILLYLWPNSAAQTVHSALSHDTGEHVTGDMPAPFKWAHDDIRELVESAEHSELLRLGLPRAYTPEEARRVKVADGIDLMFYCLRQRTAGNQHADQVFTKIRQSLFNNHTSLFLQEARLIEDLTQRYIYVGGELR